MSEKTGDLVAREYRKLADRYDERWAFYVEATLRETLRRMDLQQSDRILDVACGTGALLQMISALNPRAQLFGTDLSTEMLSVAKSRLGSAAELREGRADKLPFDSGSFDTVVSTNAFHFFRQPEEALREMSRVLQPNGRFVITDWCDDFLACRICDRLLRVFNRAHHRIYDSAKCRLLVETAGFENIEVDRYKINWLWGMMTASGSKPPIAVA
jgi:ubiquinone/menaquinone biosynthesis C-methylase UbiE